MPAFKSIVVVKQPVDLVWRTVRDYMPEIASKLDDVERVTVRERRQVDGGTIEILNDWRIRPVVPMLADWVGQENLGWLDRATWDETTRTCSWSISPFFLTDAIRCSGRAVYEAAMDGAGTKVLFEGTFDLDASRIGGVLGSVTRPAIAVAESVIKNLIPKNFRKTVDVAAVIIKEGSLPAAG